jgi:hypothetical protein
MATKKAAEETISAGELAILVGKDPKVVRGYLRKQFGRTDEQKGARWSITASVRDAAVEHFAPKEVAEAAS